jgi:hypothetical protein
MHLEFIQNKRFIAEPFAVHSAITTKKKIPDFLVFCDDSDDFYLVEVKGDNQSTVDTIIDYATNRYLLDDIDVKFVTVNKKIITKKIIGKIGKDRFIELDASYKNQRDLKFYTGFNGEKNPMFGLKGKANPNFGKKKTEEQRLKSVGKNNGMFNKTHTLSSKQKIGLKWKDQEKAKELVLSGLKTCISNLSTEQKLIYLDYVMAAVNIKVTKPKFINNYIVVSDYKIKKYFNDSPTEFINFVKGIVCQK